jgi:ribosomal protein L6P/L9E
MGTLNIVLPDDVERKLRVAVAERGGKKGDLSASVEQAILEWLQKDDRETKKGTKH